MTARSFGVTGWIYPNLRALILRDSPLLFGEARMIGFPFAVQIFAAREEVRQLQKSKAVAHLLDARDTASKPQKCPFCGTILGSSFWFGSTKNEGTGDSISGPSETSSLAFVSKAVESMFFEVQLEGASIEDKQTALSSLMKKVVHSQPGAVVAMSAVAFAGTNISREVGSGTSKCCSGTCDCCEAFCYAVCSCLGGTGRCTGACLSSTCECTGTCLGETAICTGACLRWTYGCTGTCLTALAGCTGAVLLWTFDSVLQTICCT